MKGVCLIKLNQISQYLQRTFCTFCNISLHITNILLLDTGVLPESDDPILFRVIISFNFSTRRTFDLIFDKISYYICFNTFEHIVYFFNIFLDSLFLYSFFFVCFLLTYSEFYLIFQLFDLVNIFRYLFLAYSHSFFIFSSSNKVLYLSRTIFCNLSLFSS